MDSTEQATRPMRTRKRRNGRLLLEKRPDAAANAKPATVYLFHGLGSSFLKGRRTDRRSAVGRTDCERAAALVAHLGGDPTLPEARLVRHATRYSILSDALWTRLNTDPQALAPDALAGLLDAFVKINREERETLKQLGIKRAQKSVPTLQEYLQQKTVEEPSEADPAEHEETPPEPAERPQPTPEESPADGSP